MKLEIDILSNPKEFVQNWSKYYNYSNETLYSTNIKVGLENYESFLNLFRWKNGISNISKKKLIVINKFWDKIDVLKKLQNSFDWVEFETNFEPKKSSPIWKIFLLHIIDPFNFPIFDVHVFRFHHFLIKKEIREIPNNHSKKYEYYKSEYLIWFTKLRDDFALDPKKMDESFFKFGQTLKPLTGLPFELK